MKMKKELTEEEKTIIGQQLIKILMLKQDNDYADRVQTIWGNKTPIGVFNTVYRIINEPNLML